MISLEDFQGKVVYVDVGRLGVAHVLKKFPYAKKMHSAFQEYKVIFLNVSLDRSQEVWKKLLGKEKDWLGTHIILEQRESDNCPEITKLPVFQNIYSSIKQVKSFRQMLLDRHQKV